MKEFTVDLTFKDSTEKRRYNSSVLVRTSCGFKPAWDIQLKDSVRVRTDSGHAWLWVESVTKF